MFVYETFWLIWLCYQYSVIFSVLLNTLYNI